MLEIEVVVGDVQGILFVGRAGQGCKSAGMAVRSRRSSWLGLCQQQTPRTEQNRRALVLLPAPGVISHHLQLRHFLNQMFSNHHLAVSCLPM